ncbi:PQQ-dependent sugar dehydrogenase [soil metagenome]
MRRPLLLLAATSLALAACSAPTAPPSSSPVASEAVPTVGEMRTSPSGDPSPAPATTGHEPTGPAPPLALEIVASDLADPINVTGSPEGWLLVNERAGRVVAVDPADGQTTVVLDITDRVQGGGEQGLLGLVLHPDWPDVPRAYVHYSGRSTGGDTVLSELSGTPGTADAPPTFDAASEQVLLEVEQPAANHNGGQLAFGPDGFLYIGLGDGGGANDQYGNGQDPSTLLGSILRIDVATPGARTVPADNPFVDGGGAPEVYLYGLRNPWRFSFDRATGLLWIADVGQGAFEEVNRVDPATQGGANLGWNVMEGAHCFADAGCSADGLTLPLAEYGRDLGQSVTGGFVYRGAEIPGLHGWYLFSDYLTGPLFGVPSDAAPPADGALAPVTLLETGLQVSTFGEGADGELYVADLAGGALYRIVPGP